MNYSAKTFFALNFCLKKQQKTIFGFFDEKNEEKLFWYAQANIPRLALYCVTL
jgi:hypothetical protein